MEEIPPFPEKIVGWRHIDRNSQEHFTFVHLPSCTRIHELIVQHGTWPGPRFEVKQALKGVTLYDPMDDISEDQYGEMMEKNTFIYNLSHYRSIQGVAWDYGNTENPLSLLKPTTESEYPITYVWVQWEIDRRDRRSWEKRETVQRLFRGKECGDQAIYEAAEEQERKHQEWKKNDKLWVRWCSLKGYEPREEIDFRMSVEFNGWLRDLLES
jgi:hypothetical protein